MTLPVAATPSCASCHARFPVNGELASLPHGKRLAFDPGAGRVWRICASCNYWNLVGGDTPKAVDSELRNRLTIATKPVIAQEMIGSVRVIIVTNDDDAPAAGKHGLRLRRFAPAMNWMKYLLPVLVIPWGGLAYDLSQRRFPGAGAWQSVLGLSAPWLLASQFTRWRAAKKVNPLWIALGVAAIVVAAFVLPRYQTPDEWAAPWTFELLLASLQFAFLAGTDDLFARVINTTTGKRVRMTPRVASQATFGIDPFSGRPAVFDLPGGEVALGEEVLVKSISRFDTHVAFPDRPAVEQGWTILRRHGDTVGVLRALGESRPENNGRFSWSEITPAWAFALNAACAEARGSPYEKARLRAQISKASDVARIAEELDKREPE